MIKHVKIKGKNHPIRIGYYALKMTREETGKALSTSGTEVGDNFEMFEPMVYYGLVSGYKAENKECPFKREEAEELVDECFDQILVLMPEFFPKKEQEKMTGDSKEGRIKNQKK